MLLPVLSSHIVFNLYSVTGKNLLLNATRGFACHGDDSTGIPV